MLKLMLLLPDDFDFSQFMNQKIRILQVDNFTKIGVLVETNSSYIVLKFDDGRRVFIDRNAIAGVEEVSS